MKPSVCTQPVTFSEDLGQPTFLTRCCLAHAKGSRGTVCRSCYRDVDEALGGPADVCLECARPIAQCPQSAKQIAASEGGRAWLAKRTP